MAKTVFASVSTIPTSDGVTPEPYETTEHQCQETVFVFRVPKPVTDGDEPTLAPTKLAQIPTQTTTTKCIRNGYQCLPVKKGKLLLIIIVRSIVCSIHLDVTFSEFIRPLGGSRLGQRLQNSASVHSISNRPGHEYSC